FLLMRPFIFCKNGRQSLITFCSCGHLFFARMDGSPRLFFAHAAIYFLQKWTTVLDHFLLMRPFIFCKNGWQSSIIFCSCGHLFFARMDGSP
ncbi:hypothetical protein, partial [Bacillus pumilus]|uniref:hypothetical protein n=1 Tax=Bacillus pumilus TaxID=1408 RepID=UPI001C930523